MGKSVTLKENAAELYDVLNINRALLRVHQNSLKATGYSNTC